MLGALFRSKKFIIGTSLISIALFLYALSHKPQMTAPVITAQEASFAPKQTQPQLSYASLEPSPAEVEINSTLEREISRKIDSVIRLIDEIIE